MKIIDDLICTKQINGTQTHFVEVHGHSAHPIHTLADTLDIEVCVSSGTMKNTVWDTPERFRRLYSSDPPLC